MKVELVEWHDAYSITDDWQPRGTAAVDKHRPNLAVGFADEDEDYVYLYTAHDPANDTVRGGLAVPQSQIINRVTLKPDASNPANWYPPHL